MCQGLIVVRDRLVIDRRDAEGGFQLGAARTPLVGLRQLPEPAEQTFGIAPAEHELTVRLDP